MHVHFNHEPHPHIESHRKARAPKAHDNSQGINARIAVFLTKSVGSMWCAYAFCGLALVALPQALQGGLLTTIQWLSQTFIQLVMLSVIMVGQNILSQAGDRRAEMTYKDAEATFHEARQIQAHLAQQDEAINGILDRLEGLAAKLEASKS